MVRDSCIAVLNKSGARLRFDGGAFLSWFEDKIPAALMGYDVIFRSGKIHLHIQGLAVRASLSELSQRHNYCYTMV